jgi:alpha-tubulin suppressor-like RCC1 family protein
MTFSQIVTPVTATGCGLTASGSTYCWGINNFGDLGIANPDHLSIDPLPVPNAPAFTMLAMGSGLTTNVRACGITAAKAVYCWGDNPNGQLGDGSLTRRPTPAVVSGGHAFTAIALGQMSSCALDTDGNAFCWGDNHSGELGDGTTTSRTVPTAVAGGLHFISIAVGSAHACGITTDHEAYCWGNNNFDQLGDGGTLLSQSVPGPVLGGIRFTSVVSQATSDDTCGIAVGGGVYCWGGNRGGELGYIHQEGPSGYPVPIGRP